MKTPSVEDRLVGVTARLTDEVFGHTHWRAGQFAFKEHDGHDHEAVLVIGRPGETRESLVALLTAALSGSQP